MQRQDPTSQNNLLSIKKLVSMKFIIAYWSDKEHLLKTDCGGLCHQDICIQTKTEIESKCV